MLGPAVSAIKSYVAANYSTLPLRWTNENWPHHRNPQDQNEAFIEAEIIGGKEYLAGFSKPGSRLFIHPGMIRFYIAAPQGEGMDDAIATADVFANFMQRTEFGRDEVNGRTVRTFDFSVYDGIATLDEGNYSVLMCSVEFDFYYQG